MKLCWDNLEGLRYIGKGKWRKGNVTYVYKDSCKKCEKPFLGRTKSKFCCKDCSDRYIIKGEEHPLYGRKLTGAHRKKISDATKGKKNPMYGKHHNGKTKKILSKLSTGNINASKGWYRTNNLPLYDTYAGQLDKYEEVKRDSQDKNLLSIKCYKCGKWFAPSRHAVNNRIQSINGNYRGYNYFYCSEGCKRSCSVYSKKPEQLMREDALRAGRLQWLELDREVQPELRKIVLARDDYTCQKCGTVDNILHCHHILPVVTNPIESADIDNCITYCIDCHKQAHDQDGCRYNDLKEEIC